MGSAANLGCIIKRPTRRFFLGHCTKIGPTGNSTL